MTGQRIINKRDTNDATTTTVIALNSSTAVKIVDAGTEKVQVVCSNPDNQPIWIKFQPAATDDLKQGIFLPGKDRVALILGQGFYTGEISAIAAAGTPDIHIVEY